MLTTNKYSQECKGSKITEEEIARRWKSFKILHDFQWFLYKNKDLSIRTTGEVEYGFMRHFIMPL